VAKPKAKPKKRAPKKPAHDQEFIWARSEREAIRLQGKGWTLAQHQPVHHNHFAMLLTRKAKS